MEKKLIRKSEQKPDTKTDRPDLPDAELEQIAGGTFDYLICPRCGQTFPPTAQGTKDFGDHQLKCIKPNLLYRSQK
jgi:ribosomal protein L40E